jgi:hypothetical protein
MVNDFFGKKGKGRGGHGQGHGGGGGGGGREGSKESAAVHGAGLSPVEERRPMLSAVEEEEDEEVLMQHHLPANHRRAHLVLEYDLVI